MASRYTTTKTVTQENQGVKYYTNTIYPEIPERSTDYFAIVVLGDRLDLLAQSFYGDSSLWWIIASANALPGDSLYPPIGAQLRIPTDIQNIVASFKLFNNAKL